MQQLTSPLERLLQPGVQPSIAYPPSGNAPWNGAGLLPIRRSGDGISVCPLPPGAYGNQPGLGGFGPGSVLGSIATMSPFGALMQKFMQMIQQFVQMLGGAGSPFGFTGFGSEIQPEKYFNDATASSTGDPHLAFNGTEGNGKVDSTHFDSMAGHQDLVDSDSFAGGYTVSTAVSTPNANGVTVNKSATLTTNYGQTQISLNNAGAVSITENGQPIQIQTGQTLDVGCGQTVTKNNDGSLTMINTDGQGGTMNTTFKNNGGAVDVTTTAHNVDVGGDIVNQLPIAQPGGGIWMHPDQLRTHPFAPQQNEDSL